MKTIKMRIDKLTGKVTLETSGFIGPACMEATKELESGLGLVSGDINLTSEFYDTQNETGHVTDGQ